jgi:hypothetical protein
MVQSLAYRIDIETRVSRFVSPEYCRACQLCSTSQL